MSKYKKTATKINVSYSGQNPIFGEGVTEVSIDDEAAGAFIILHQDGSSIRLDIEELEVIVDVAKDMISKYNQNKFGDIF